MDEKETSKNEHSSHSSEVKHPHTTTSDPTQGIVRTNSYLEENNVRLGWRSWVVVFVTCYAIMAQVFVVVAAGSVIAFIVPSFPEQASIVGWVIQGPLLMQSVLSPIIGRLSDVLDRKYLASLPPLIAFAGACISAKATSMNMLIGGGILIGTTLSTIAIVQAIPSEVLPLKYRALANGFAFLGGAIGSLVGILGAGAVTNANPEGWRNIFWMQAAFHGSTTLGLLLFYHPKRASDFPRMSAKQLIWACDPVGSLLFISSTTLMLMALDWAGGTFPWSNAHVAALLSIGLVLLAVFCLYEWKGRSDGLLAHVFFQGSPNFALSVFAFAVEGWIFYSAVNSVVPLIDLNLGFESSAWHISIRQLSYNLVALFTSIPIMLYSTKYKDLKSPLLITFAIFLIVCICYATINPSNSRAQFGYNVIAGIGQSGPLTLIVALVQFTAPHAYLSTATGLAFSARAIGGAFGSAVLDAIINSKLHSDYANKVGSAAVEAGLPENEVGALVAALLGGQPTSDISGVNATVLEAAIGESREVYASAYRLAYSSIIPFVVLAIVAVAYLKGVRELMTNHVEATVEHVDSSENLKA